MIRELRKADINKVAYIWLDTNVKAHDFIPAQYWKNNFESVKEALQSAEVYVYEIDKEIQGFIGFVDEYIEGIFVSDKMQSQGIGKALLDYAKDKRSKLFLNVYQKNTRAISFYQREGFEVRHSGLDESTGEKEYLMVWQRKHKFKSTKKNMKNANQLIGCCGLDCEKCDARIATLTNDNALREKTAELWTKLNGVPITPEMINCTGCRMEGAKTPFCDKLCPVHNCVREKGFDTCADCEQMDECPTLGQIAVNSSFVLENLNLLREAKKETV